MKRAIEVLQDWFCAGLMAVVMLALLSWFLTNMFEWIE